MKTPLLLSLDKRRCLPVLCHLTSERQNAALTREMKFGRSPICETEYIADVIPVSLHLKHVTNPSRLPRLNATVWFIVLNLKNLLLNRCIW